MVLNLLISIITATSPPKKTDGPTSQQTRRFTILKFNNFKIENSSSLRYASLTKNPHEFTRVISCEIM